MTRIPIDPDSIRRLATVLVETGLTEIEIAEKDSRIRVVRGAAPAEAVAVVAPPAIAQPRSSAPPPTAPTNADDLADHPGAVTSPMVGVAYLAPEPGAPNFVGVGTQVVAGQTVLLIEAMKTFNQIKATKSGTVTRILVENSAPVEYGEILMVVE